MDNLSPWLELRIIYMKIRSHMVDESIPDCLTLNLTASSPERSISSSLRRDRVDRASEEANYVSTDSIRIMGSMKFEVCDKDDLLLTGQLEFANSGNPEWNIKCRSQIIANGFLKQKLFSVMELYIAGSSSGAPVILTQTIQLSLERKQSSILEANPIDTDNTSKQERASRGDSAKGLLELRDCRQDVDVDIDYNSLPHSRLSSFVEDEGGELSWFNAGVRVGVGIGLGICMGVGIGVGLMIRTYQSTTRNFRWRWE